MENKGKYIGRAIEELSGTYDKCGLCGRMCMVDRHGSAGGCGSRDEMRVFCYMPHSGEEPPLSGDKGSGTIFFSGCSMSCVYCQNGKFSQEMEGSIISTDVLSMIMLKLQRQGCHNVNLVSPTHFVPSIVDSLNKAVSEGMNIPVVYNTGGYDSEWVIQALEGVVDVYLVDMKYSSGSLAAKFSGVSAYTEINRSIVKEMYRQVGDLEVCDGIARKGLIIRLLVLPNNISGTEETLRFIKKELGNNVYISLMSQYYPAYKARGFDEISDRLKPEYYGDVVSALEDLGFQNGWVQPLSDGVDHDYAGERFRSNF